MGAQIDFDGAEFLVDRLNDPCELNIPSRNRILRGNFISVVGAVQRSDRRLVERPYRQRGLRQSGAPEQKHHHHKRAHRCHPHGKTAPLYYACGGPETPPPVVTAVVR